ncbi:hypothetical protein MATL_G00042510 [Megalops atlanticus]|uniref:Linker for activation of T-cells family member 2 n=1 Tax=Megalops atlanticus TaxID=7932 RepID=A0A9D3Q8Z4_MEGAT|nr:hypothetical protein MATL_G00042510 [Megalops atlanticus]
MTPVFSQQGAGLAVVTLVTVGFLCAMCLRCRRRPRIIQEENHIYKPQLCRGGSRFTVVRSKTVTRPNQITKDLPPTPMGSPREICASPECAEDQPSYQNVANSKKGDPEALYVNPIPGTIYQNVTNSDKDADSYSYENVFPTVDNPINQDSDSSGYENTSFLKMKEDDDEPDYVNTESET